MATILQLKVAKRQLFEKVSLEHCAILATKANTVLLNFINMVHLSHIMRFTENLQRIKNAVIMNSNQ